MIPMEPGPEDYARQLAERRARMQQAQAIVYMAHSRTGVMLRFLKRLADRIDPTGLARRDLR